MRQRSSFLWMALPLLVFFFLAFALFVERSGINYKVSVPPTDFLDPLTTEEYLLMTEPDLTINKECLVLFDSEGFGGLGSFQTVVDTLDSMQVPYDTLYIHSADTLNMVDYETVVITFIQLDNLSDEILDLVKWVGQGGRLMFAIRPDPSSTFSSIYRKMGIISKGEGLIGVQGVKFMSDLLPGSSGIMDTMDLFSHSSLPVSLEDQARLHLVSADDYQLPIFWEKDYGSGRFVFINTDQFIGKTCRGVIAAAYSLLKDFTVYPVINSSTFFIDDFPSPVPEGSDEGIFRQFGRDIENFYINIWWPDLQGIARKYRLKYTGVVIETYEHLMTPPFDFGDREVQLFQYFGGSLLKDGSEIGLHGFNHVPFCKKEDGFNQTLGYPVWELTDDMQQSINELNRFITSLFPDQPVRVYVPPSNILCPEAREWLPQILPDLRAIASVYIPDADIPEYEQEFTEAADGLVELPRIVAGYDPDASMRWAALNELALHFTHAHFVHPDDVLDDMRSQGKSWTILREKLDEYLLWIFTSAPGIRNMTASESAMAVQRFNRLRPASSCNENGCEIALEGFYDEAWLMVRSKKEPVDISGGAISEVASGWYLLKASEPLIKIRFKE